MPHELQTEDEQERCYRLGWELADAHRALSAAEADFAAKNFPPSSDLEKQRAVALDARDTLQSLDGHVPSQDREHRRRDLADRVHAAYDVVHRARERQLAIVRAINLSEAVCESIREFPGSPK